MKVKIINLLDGKVRVYSDDEGVLWFALIDITKLLDLPTAFTARAFEKRVRPSDSILVDSPRLNPTKQDNHLTAIKYVNRRGLLSFLTTKSIPKEKTDKLQNLIENGFITKKELNPIDKNSIIYKVFQLLLSKGHTKEEIRKFAIQFSKEK
jgi:hypothetical protein